MDYLAKEKKARKQHRARPVLYYVDQMSAPYMANWRMPFTPEFSNREPLVSLFKRAADRSRRDSPYKEKNVENLKVAQ